MSFEREINWCTQNHLWTSSSMHQEGYIRNIIVQIYFCKFLSYREVWYTNLYVHCETNPMVWSKSLMDIILPILIILHASGRLYQEHYGLDLLLSIFELQRSVIYQFVFTLWDKFNGVIIITYEHHFSNPDYPSWIRKGSWMMTRSTFELQRSVIYQFVCTLQDKFNGVVKITYGHLPWSKEDSPWINKGS